MNTTRFTTRELNGIIPFIMEHKIGMIESGDRHLSNPDLVEWTNSEDFKIIWAEMNDDTIFIEFEQFLDDEIPGWGLTYTYQILQTIEDFKEILEQTQR